SILSYHKKNESSRGLRKKSRGLPLGTDASKFAFSRDAIAVVDAVQSGVMARDREMLAPNGG
ncbi:hypothetical protein, partial [Laspinema olomoucense]|uniref:hypothetical protein n=1 Tax=Laspinema olomoucense TaxID=3231600 RepID=UPI0021BAFC9C